MRRLRLVSGLVLFAYVCSHLGNLALGLVSLATMDAVRPVIMGLWTNPAGLVVLYGALALHLTLGFVALYHRRTLRMPAYDALQLAMALALPPLLVIHVLGTRVASLMVEFQPTYAWLMVLYWKLAPLTGLRQVAVVMVAWIHGCMGVYYWVRLRPWWTRWQSLLYPLVFLVPVAALLGFVEAGKEALVLVADPQWKARVAASAAAVDRDVVAALYRAESGFLMAYFAALAGVLAARGWRLRGRGGRGTVEVRYRHGPTVEAQPGLSLLEISRTEDVHHTSLCGGKGRCGTCRIRILSGAEHLDAPGAVEAATLARVGAEPGVRLACQCVPTGSPLVVQRLVAPDASADAALRADAGVRA